MSALYTVTMRREIITTVYGKGNTAETKTTYINETYRDLPHLTAMGYKKKFPDAVIEIAQQAHAWGNAGYATTAVKVVGDKKGTRTKIDASGFDNATKRVEQPKPKQAAKTPKPASPEIKTGTYADVVNEMLKETA